MRLIALWLGAIGLPLTLLWSVAGAGFYGSPLSEVTRDGLPIILAIFVLGGPLGLLPLAILSRRWPRPAGAAMLAGGECARLLATHPWGLGYAAPGLYSDTWHGQAFTPIAFVTMALGAALLVIGRGRRGWLEVLGIVVVSTFTTLAVASSIERRVAYAPFRTLHPIRFLAFGPDGRALFAGGRSYGVRASPASLSLVDADTGEVKVLGEDQSGWAISPDRKTLVMIWRDTVFLNTRTLRVFQRQPRARGPVAVSTTGYAAVPLAGGVQVATLSRARHPPLLAHEGETRWLAWSPDGGTLAIGRWKHEDVLLVQPPFSELRTLRVAGGGDLEGGQYSPDGRLLAVAAASGSGAGLRLWTASDGRELSPLDERPVAHAQWFAPNGGTLLTLRLDDAAVPPRIWLTLWDTATWSRKATFPGTPPYAWSPDGSVLVTLEPTDTGRSSRVVSRRVADGAVLGVLGSVDFMPWAVAFSADGTRVAVAGDGKMLQGYTRGDVAVFRSDTQGPPAAAAREPR